MGCNLCFSIISIHAPTRGATYQQVHFTVAYIIFQSTLPREERRIDVRQVSLVFNVFQSTLPREERPGVPRFQRLAISISIHAPTRGATCPNHLVYGSSDEFQSTLPREERLAALGALCFLFLYFNPRSHERSDVILPITSSRSWLFQSTLPREERPRSDGPVE